MTVFAEFRAPVSAHPLGRFLAGRPDVAVDVERGVPVGGSTHHVWVGGAGRADLVDELRGTDDVARFAVVDELPDRLLVRFDWESGESPVFGLADEFDATPVGVLGTSNGWSLRFRFADVAALRAFHERSRERVTPLELRRTYDPDGWGGDHGHGLTETQRETLVRAYEAGYFEIPRQVTLMELADRLGVSEQAVSERLRRGLWSLLAATAFEDRPG